jgi:predicted flap endonuclease-1-like 5' DNA nuclease
MPLPYETATQFAGLGLTLVAGWFLGLASRSGGSKWRERYQDEELEHARYRDEAEARIRALEIDLAAARKQAAAAVPAAVAVPAEDTPGASWRGWFGWGRDNLARIKGIDEARERRLNELGIKTYREIEKMAPDDEAALEQRLEIPAGTIGEQGWREQAALLRAGNERAHAERFG